MDIDGRFRSTGFSRKLVPPYKLPPEGGTTNINFNVTDY